MAVKGNGQLPYAHFHKDWQRRIKTWFDQPARKQRRRTARKEKAERAFPRPIDRLRPAVRAQTRKYNYRVRVGRGFTLEELKVSGIKPKYARTIGICVDHRRKNRCKESLNTNVLRLKEYKKRLVVPSKKELAKIRSAHEKTIDQVSLRSAFPIKAQKPAVEFHKITEEDRKFKAFHKLRMVRDGARNAGLHAMKARRLAEEEAAKKK